MFDSARAGGINLFWQAANNTGTVERLTTSPNIQVPLSISPDGRWLAYQSNASGRDEVYVRPFPNVDAGNWTISTSGGTRPLWARNGTELFYLDRAGAMTRVPIQTTPTFSAGPATTLFETRYLSGGVLARTFDVSPDGQRFLMIKDTAAAQAPTMVVVLNWLEELQAKLSVK